MGWEQPRDVFRFKHKRLSKESVAGLNVWETPTMYSFHPVHQQRSDVSVITTTHCTKLLCLRWWRAHHCAQIGGTMEILRGCCKKNTILLIVFLFGGFYAAFQPFFQNRYSNLISALFTTSMVIMAFTLHRTSQTRENLRIRGEKLKRLSVSPTRASSQHSYLGWNG